MGPAGRSGTPKKPGRTGSRAHAIGWLVILLLVACASADPRPVYKLYPGPVRPAAELATLHFEAAANAFRVDGLLVERGDWDSVELLPGEYVISWGKTFSVSPLVDPSGMGRAEETVRVELEAGHRYAVCADRTTGKGYRMFLWIEDWSTGEVVGGVRKP